MSEHRKTHTRWKTPTKCQVCRIEPSYNNFARHMLSHYTYDKRALTVAKASGGNYPLVYHLKEKEKYKQDEPRPSTVVYFNWRDGDRDVADF